MSHPLDGPRLKIERAKSEIERLRLLQDVFRQQSRYSIIKADKNPETGNDTYRLKVRGSPPSPEWSIAIGEITHNLRCSLNYIVFQLTLLRQSLETVARDRSLQFPIYGDPDEFRRNSKRMIKLISPKHQALVEGLQPYHGGANDHPLIWLEEINNADKHRLVQVVGAKISAGPTLAWWGDRDTIPMMNINGFTILEDDAEIYNDIPPDMHVNENIIPSIAFADGCEVVKGKGVIITLNNITNHVSDIVESFASEF